MPWQTRFDKHAGKLLVILYAVLTIAALAAAEWWLTPEDGRYAGDAHSSGAAPARYLRLREWKRNTDYRMAPTAQRMAYAEGKIPAVYPLAIDENGFIEPSRTHADPDVTIVFLGGSTTECLYVAPENRFPHLTARNLEEKLGVKVNGINGARSGNNTMHSLLLMLGKVIPLKPDYVVLMHAANDLGLLSSGKGYWAARGGTRLIENEKRTVGRAIQIAANATIPHTAQRLTRGWRNLVKIFRSSPAAAAPQLQSGNAGPATHARPEQDFASALRSFVALAKAWGITPVLMTQPYVPAAGKAERKADFLDREQLRGSVDNRSQFEISHTAFNDTVRQVANSTGAILIDLAAVHAWQYGEVYDGLHFTDKGSRIVADLIAAKLQDALRERLAR